MIYRPWTSVGVIAGFKATTPSAIVVEEKDTGVEIVLSRCAFVQKDKDWLNARRGNMIDKQSFSMLLPKTKATSPNAFRLWTASEKLALAEEILLGSVRLLLLGDRTTLEVSVDDLSEADHAYLQEHFTADMIDRLRSETAEPGVAGSDVDAEYEVDQPDEIIQVSAGKSSRGTVANPQAIQNSVIGSRGSSTPLPEEPYEAITGAPIRSWTDDGFMANLVGIANRMVYLRVEGEDGTRKLPMADWTVVDKEWLRDYLVDEQRRILSGKLRK